MGRNSTGAITTGESIRLELSYLLKNKYIEDKLITEGEIGWNNGIRIMFTSDLNSKEKFIRLTYSTINRHSGEESKQDYKIFLAAIPSNLGRGQVIYFVCPVSGKRARILYLAYGSLFFKSRLAYVNRLYYSGQICQKLNYDKERYFILKDRLASLPICKKNHYRGNATKLQKRRQDIEEKLAYHDWKSCLILVSYLEKVNPF